MNGSPRTLLNLFRNAAAARAVPPIVLAMLLSGCRPGPNARIPESGAVKADGGAAGRIIPGRFYATAKPYTRWWWFASEIRKDDIARQLDWLKAHGFGGVEVAWVYPLNIERYKRWYTWISDDRRKVLEPRPAWQSPEWSDLVAFAKAHADRIGLGMDFTYGSAWPFGDSRVPAADGAKVYGRPDFKQEVIISWEYPVNGLVIDHMDKGAFERYAARMSAALAKAAGTGLRSGFFVDSWEVETNGLWTDGFGDAFQARFGYAVEPYMDAIMAPENAGPRYDYLKLVSEFVIGNFYEPFTKACHDAGAFSRVQANGSPTDLIAAYSTADVPETEALLYEPGFARVAASAAVLSGKRDVTSETFTCSYGFPRDRFKEEQAADLKLIADAVLANGVNRIIWHGTPFNAAGEAHDNEFYASVHVGERGALSGELAAFNRYMEKVATFMGEGVTYSNMAVYIPVEDEWVRGEYPKELQLPWSETGAYGLRYIAPAAEIKGYHPLWINGKSLKAAVLVDGRLAAGDASFASLYVDVEYMDIESLETVLELAKKGFPVCLKKKPVQPGRNRSALYPALLEELSGLSNVAASLRDLPLPRPLVEGEDLPDFWCRVKDGETVIFFAQPRAGNLTLPLQYGQSYTDTDTTRRVTLNVNGRSLPLDLVFKPYQSILVRVDGDGRLSFVDISYVPPAPKVG